MKENEFVENYLLLFALEILLVNREYIVLE